MKPILAKVKATVVISDEIINMAERFYIKATAKLIDIESGEHVEVSAFAREEENKKGMDSSQVTGSTSSYARKYALNGLFAIDDTKDADTLNHHGQQSEPKPKKALSSQTSAELNKLIKEYSELTSKPVGEISQELIKVVNKPLKDISEYEADTLLRYLNVSIAENKENG